MTYTDTDHGHTVDGAEHWRKPNGTCGHCGAGMTDYSTSKFDSATAERTYGVVLDGFAAETIYEADGTAAFDLATDPETGGAVILRYSSQGFVDVEMAERDEDSEADVHGHYGRDRVLCHWQYLRREYEPAEDED